MIFAFGFDAMTVAAMTIGEIFRWTSRGIDWRKAEIARAQRAARRQERGR